jgi:hypothetical protein
MLTRLKNFFMWPWNRYHERKRLKKRMEELRKRDPFLYE